MANIKDYVLANGHRSFDDLPLNELDIACLNELGYLTFGEHLPETLDRHRYHRLADLLADLAAADWEQPAYDFLVTPARIDLLRAVLTSRRFGDLELGRYVNEVSIDYEKQFAAMVMRLPGLGYTQLIFRGTDDSLIGWKEDFNMSYRRVIPAQQAALSYLRNFLADVSGELVISGHSKGGNLALYASSLLPTTQQERIRAVYVFDAPGLHPSVLNSPGYQAIQPKVKAFRPEESIVSVMLASNLPYVTVASQQSGLLQHDLFNWLVNDGTFQIAAGLSPLSLNLEKTFSIWLDRHGTSDLKQFFDSFFEVFFISGITSLNQVSATNRQQVFRLLASLNQLAPHQRTLMKQGIKELIDIYRKTALETMFNQGATSINQEFLRWQQDLKKTFPLSKEQSPLNKSQ